MEKHFILGNSTLLVTGLNHILKDFGYPTIQQIPFEGIKEYKFDKISEDMVFWIDGSYNYQIALNFCQSQLKELSYINAFIFCSSTDPQLIKCFLKAGITGYFLPQCSVKCIEEALFQVSKGNIFIDPLLWQSLSENLLGLESKKIGFNPLTKREKQILNLIVEENTTQEIANKLFIGTCTVETHRLHLIQKLGVKNIAGLVREAITQNIYSYP